MVIELRTSTRANVRKPWLTLQNGSAMYRMVDMSPGFFHGVKNLQTGWAGRLREEVADLSTMSMNSKHMGCLSCRVATYCRQVIHP